jgi:hypothetical protein
MAALNSLGKQVFIGDQVSIIATVVSQAEFGSTNPSQLALVTSGTVLTSATFVHQGNDANAVQHSNDTSNPHYAVSLNGKSYGQPGDSCTVLGTVTAISGNGNTAALTVKLVSSGLIITVPAGATTSASAVGGIQ